MLLVSCMLLIIVCIEYLGIVLMAQPYYMSEGGDRRCSVWSLGDVYKYDEESGRYTVAASKASMIQHGTLN